jgi:diamine N-acetyltransferase
MRLSNYLDSSSSESLIIRRAEKPDIPVLQGICDAWIERSFFEGETLASDYIEQCLKNGDLPPILDAKIENYALFVIEDNQSIIGLFDLYDGYPNQGIVWISLFLLDVEYRGSKLGSKVIDKIVSSCRSADVESLALAVSMNNRLAFKFWVNRGFKEILGIYGDIKYPVIGLKMKL